MVHPIPVMQSKRRFILYKAQEHDISVILDSKEIIKTTMERLNDEVRD
jgi:hypothetical protein